MHIRDREKEKYIFSKLMDFIHLHEFIYTPMELSNVLLDINTKCRMSANGCLPSNLVNNPFLRDIPECDCCPDREF